MNSIYWSVDNKKTKSKGEALIWAKGDISKIYFYFNDDEWKNKSFSQEPKKSFEDLAIERCKFLRNKTKWLALFLSSGYDSTTVLHFFIISKQKLDEIIIFKRYSDFCIEYQKSCLVAENYRLFHNPRVKITYIELSKEYLLNFYKKFKSDFILAPGLSLRFSKNSLSLLGSYNDDIIRGQEQNYDRIDITGFEKPRVTLYENKWYAFMSDSAVIDNHSDVFTGFFTDIDSFDLNLKQHFMVIDWFENLKELTNELVHSIQSHNRFYFQLWNLACGRVSVNSDWSTHGDGKKLFKNSTESPDSIKLTKHFKEENIYKYYKEGIKNLQNYVTWWNSSDDIISKINISSSLKFIKNYEKKT